MDLRHIELKNLKTTKLNVRRVGAKEIADLAPSIRALGLLQPLLVRPNGDGFEVVAGQRRFHALSEIAKDGDLDPVPCIVMADGDDATAIEASLAENIARLPMDEIDQYKAFAALVKQGLEVAEIASRFGVTERLVKQRLAIANLLPPILTAYRRDEISAQTLCSLTMASRTQQKAWLDLMRSEDAYAPQGHALKQWLFGGASIPTSNALFDLADYDGEIIGDLFGDERYFDNAATFWAAQNTAIAAARDRYLAMGWTEVILLDIGDYFPSYEYVETPKEEGGKVFVQVDRDGAVTIHEGLLTRKEVSARERGADGAADAKAMRPELTKAMQNYLALHRHAAVRSGLLAHPGIALRLAVAQIIAGSDLWSVQADPQSAASDAVADSLNANRADATFTAERQAVMALLMMEAGEDATLVPRKGDWQVHRDLHAIFATLLRLTDADVSRILTFVVAETLPCGSAMVEALGLRLKVDLCDHWAPDETFFDLLRDKAAINAMLAEVGGTSAADANVAATAKVQKRIIRDYLDGTRPGAKECWQPRYASFPMTGYTGRGELNALENWDRVKQHYPD